MGDRSDFATPSAQTNGAGAAALLAAGIGTFMVAALAFAADKYAFIKAAFNFWKPTGPLSGVTTSAILVWLIVWALLHARWKRRAVDLGPLSIASLIMLGLSVLLTFPPLADLL